MRVQVASQLAGAEVLSEVAVKPAGDVAAVPDVIVHHPAPHLSILAAADFGETLRPFRLRAAELLDLDHRTRRFAGRRDELDYFRLQHHLRSGRDAVRP